MNIMDNDRKKRICFVIDRIDSPTAGTEKQILLLINNLDRSRFSPYLAVLQITPWLRNNLQSCVMHEIGLLSSNPLLALLAIGKFSWFLRRENIDIVQTYFRDSSFVGLLSAKFAGVKVRIGSRRNQGFWMNRWEYAVQNLLNRITTLFIANCENTKEWVISHEKMKTQRVRVIYNGLEIDKYPSVHRAERKMLKEQLGFEEDTVLVGIVANLRAVKEIDVFLKASVLVSLALPHARFVIVGDGPDKSNLESLCRDLGLNSVVRFLGKREDVSTLLSCMDIGVLSSSSESFSNAILEYMAAGLPVVCTDVGGAREAVEDCVNGFVVPKGDHKQMAERIIEIIESKSFVKMGEKGREKAVVVFSSDRMINSYQNLYEEVV